jgi:hypothetical protein
MFITPQSNCECEALTVDGRTPLGLYVFITDFQFRVEGVVEQTDRIEREKERIAANDPLDPRGPDFTENQ